MLKLTLADHPGKGGGQEITFTHCQKVLLIIKCWLDAQDNAECSEEKCGQGLWRPEANGFVEGEQCLYI